MFKKNIFIAILNLNNVTITEFSRRVGISTNTIRAAMRGYCPATKETVAKILNEYKKLDHYNLNALEDKYQNL